MRDIDVGKTYKHRNSVTVKVTSLTNKDVTFVDNLGLEAQWPRYLFAAEFLDEPYENFVIRDLQCECKDIKERVETLRERDEAWREAASMRVPFDLAQRERDEAREESASLRCLVGRQEQVICELLEERNDLKERVETLERERDEAYQIAPAKFTQMKEENERLRDLIERQRQTFSGLRNERGVYKIASSEFTHLKDETESLRGLIERQRQTFSGLRDERNDLKERVETLERERDEARCEAAAAAAEANERAADLAACLQDRFDADQGLRDAVALECLRATLHPSYAASGMSLIEAAGTAYRAADAFLVGRNQVQIPATDLTKVS